MVNVADFVQVSHLRDGRRFESLRTSFGIFILNKVYYAIEIHIYSAYSLYLFLLEVHTVMSLNSLPESGFDRTSISGDLVQIMKRVNV